MYENIITITICIKQLVYFDQYKVDASFDQFLAHPQTIIIQNAPI